MTPSPQILYHFARAFADLPNLKTMILRTKTVLNPTTSLFLYSNFTILLFYGTWWPSVKRAFLDRDRRQPHENALKEKLLVPLSPSESPFGGKNVARGFYNATLLVLVVILPCKLPCHDRPVTGCFHDPTHTNGKISLVHENLL